MVSMAGGRIPLGYSEKLLGHAARFKSEKSKCGTFQTALVSFRLLLRAGASGVEPKIISNPCCSSMCKIVCGIKGAAQLRRQKRTHMISVLH